MGKLISVLYILLFCSYLFAGDAELMKEAKTAFSKKSYGEAIKKFTKYTEQVPSQGEAYMYLGYIYEYKKDYPRSIANFRKSAELELSKEQRKTVLLKLALFFNYHQDWNLAAAYSSRYLKINPGNEEMQKIYNRAVGNRGNPNSSTSYIAPVKQETKPEIKKEELVRMEPVKKIQESKPQPIKTDEAYEQVLAEQPNNEEVRWDYVLNLFEDKKYEKAESQLNYLIEKFPGRTRYHYKLGIVKLRQDDPKTAIVSFERAKKNPFSKDTNVFLYYVFLNEGLAYQKLNDLAKAESSYLEAFKQLPKDTPLIALTRLNQQKPNFEACVSYADKALTMTQDSAEVHMFRFICLFELNKRTPKFETSYSKYKQAIESNSDKSKMGFEKLSPGYLKLARKLLEENQWEKADLYFSKLESDPVISTSREYLFYRGKNYFVGKRYDDSLTYLQKIEGSAAAFYLMARIYSKKFDLTKVKENFKKGADLKPEYWTFDVLEKDFKEVWRDPSFQEFLSKKGLESGNSPKLDSTPTTQSSPPSPSMSSR